MIRKCLPQERKTIFRYLEERFGLEKDIFDGFMLYINQNEDIFLGSKSIIKKPEVISLGTIILRSKLLNPTITFFQMFGKHIKKNFIEIERKQVADYVSGKNLTVHNKNLTDGYVLVKYKEFSLGCALLKGNKLENMLSKPKISNLKFF